jgi:chromosome segregation protein
MRLDHLEISGFKSFPDRADVAFDVGVTAIVGPNGCGKSNLVDAITWVLGEQSAKSLRGDRMEDVIFSGSDARKATAAAEVRLRLSGLPTEKERRAAARREGLDIAGGDHVADAAAIAQQTLIELPSVETRNVEIGRRLYRSGESEYLIDGEGCRLRDIHDLLMDAGLGIKAYAVIEQGKIGQILSAKPTERRQLIEEAAGVTKYKSRRRTAELKLDAAQQNLTRVDDIIFELEKQRAALKRQAAKARRYRRLREELRRWEKVLFARRYASLAEQLDAARARLAESRRLEGTAAERLQDVERQFGEARTALHRADERLREIRERTYARELDNERREQLLAFNRQQIESLVSTALEMAAEIAALEERREPARIQLDARRGAAGQAERQRDEAAERLKQADEAATVREQSLYSLERAVEDARSRLFASQNTVVTLQYAIERSRDGRGRLSDTLQRLDAEAADASIEADRLRAEHDEAESRLSTVRGEIERLRSARVQHEGVLASAREQHHQGMNELRSRERESAAQAARLHSLEELEAHREGYGDAARLVLADGAGAIAHHGSVADYLETDSQHERVVEASLGELLQCVVVSNHDDARRGIDYVRARNAGRVGFLLADERESAVDTERVDLPHATPIADVVRVSGPYRGVILDALRDTWLAETADRAREYSAQTRGSVATPDGDAYRDGCVVFGGTRSEGLGILATKRQIKELRQRTGEDDASLDAVARQVADLEGTVAETDRLIAAAAREAHDLEKTALGLELQVDRARGELDRLARKREQIGSERRQADQERQALQTREDEATERITSVERERAEWQAQLAQAQQTLAEARDAASTARRHASEAKAEHAALVERAAGIANEVQKLEEAGKDLEDRIDQRNEDRRRSEDRKAHLEAAVVEGESQRVDDVQALAALREEARGAEVDLQHLQRVTDTCESAVADARGALESVRAEAARLEVARATTEGELHHLRAACADTLQMTLDEVADEVAARESDVQAVSDVAAEADDDEELEEAPDGSPATPVETVAPAEPARMATTEETIADLRGRIERLGPVNMMAIEQFDELEQRHGFLSSQRKDLVDSIAATGEAIKRIDLTTRERFREAFAAINKYFEETFTTLFGGGRAGLVLLDDDDLLESGIDIIAQPPGKRLQNVQLLSGGEKALTAMALMFGIFRYRPSPFCLLDEIDAPLDDANIGRFIEMLRGMQENTQFILVTHHRKTMEIADRLYGVTMEEPGVSKLISLRLN